MINFNFFPFLKFVKTAEESIKEKSQNVSKLTCLNTSQVKDFQVKLVSSSNKNFRFFQQNAAEKED